MKKIYMVTWLVEPAQKAALDAVGKRERLISYAHLEVIPGGKSGRAIPLKEYAMAAPKPDLFLDSGAFSAHTQGIVIPLDEYIQFIHAHKEHFTVYASLDVIGDPVGTWRNQQEMERQGLKPLPCVHLLDADNDKWMKHYLDRYDYFALGGMGSAPMETIRRWLDRAFGQFLTDAKGKPRVRIHGFAMTSVELMLRYPFYSVDSTSWVLTGRYGGAFIPLPCGMKDPTLCPVFKNGQHLPGNKHTHKVVFSSKSPKLSEIGKHYDTYDGPGKRAIADYLASKGKYTPKSLAEDYTQRDEINIHFFLDLERSWQERPFQRLNVRPEQDLGI